MFLMWLCVAAFAMSLIEYVVHRFVLHDYRAGFLFRDHYVEHHVQLINGWNWLTAVSVSGSFLTAAGVLWIYGASEAAVGTAIVGIAYAIAMPALHASIHGFGFVWLRRLPGWQYFNDHHQRHHDFPKSNYGFVFGPVWDIVFRTQR